MRVKLSYTVESDDVLKETAKILNLSGEDLQQCISLFKQVQEELVADEPDSAPNVARALEMVDEFRRALLAMDTRLLEVAEIVAAYDDYRRAQRRTPEGAEENPPQDSVMADHLGAD